MMLNYDFIGDFIQGMMDMLIPNDGFNEDDFQNDSSDFEDEFLDPSPEDRDTEDSEVNEDALQDAFEKSADEALRKYREQREERAQAYSKAIEGFRGYPRLPGDE